MGGGHPGHAAPRDAVNVYCDESCHLEHDGIQVMLLGALWCPTQSAKKTADDLRSLKLKHGLSRDFEVKWTKVSEGKLDFYLDTVDYFFDTGDLHFRALIVPDKGLLRHEDFAQDHDTFYYKMYYQLLAAILNPKRIYSIYLDIKDTRSQHKVLRLQEFLRASKRDFDRSIIGRMQHVRSSEVEHIQLADLLLGAVAYRNRGLSGNKGKLSVVERIRERSGYSLVRTTLLREDKVNIFRWTAQGTDE